MRSVQLISPSALYSWGGPLARTYRSLFFIIRLHTPFSPYDAPRFPHMSEINSSVSGTYSDDASHSASRLASRRAAHSVVGNGTLVAPALRRRADATWRRWRAAAIRHWANEGGTGESDRKGRGGGQV